MMKIMTMMTSSFAPEVALIVPGRARVLARSPLVGVAVPGSNGRAWESIEPPKSPVVFGRVQHSMGVHGSREAAKSEIEDGGAGEAGGGSHKREKQFSDSRRGSGGIYVGRKWTEDFVVYTSKMSRGDAMAIEAGRLTNKSEDDCDGQ